MNGNNTYLYIKELAKTYGKINLTINAYDKYINYSIISGYGYEFDSKGNPRKFDKLSFIHRPTFEFITHFVEKSAKGLENGKL